MINNSQLSRRQMLAGGAVLAAGLGLLPRAVAADTTDPLPVERSEFVYCLNTATIRGQRLGIVKEIEVAAKAGYQAMEPWVESIDAYAKSGGSLVDLKNRLKDAGLVVESAIGFPEWVVDDDARRAKGLERAKYEMDLVAKIGGKRIAAPPSGATDKPGLDLNHAAERYRALLLAGESIGVVPELELWGSSKNLNRFSVCAYVAIEAAHPNACLLPDIYHLYKGGSGFTGLRLLSAQAIHVIHVNDYPSDPPVEKINDSYRVYPGDGIAPMDEILQTLKLIGGRKILSLELFNQKYYQQDALVTAQQGLVKMKAAVAKAIRG